MLSPNFSPFPLLQTERLLLRQITLNDAPAVQHLRSNPEVMKYINRPLTLTIEQAQAWITVILDALAKNDGITWCIALKNEPELHIGSVGLWRIEKEHHRAEIGYMIEPAMQGKGYMYEAIKEVVDYGFKVMKLHSIEAHIDPRNKASEAVLKKTGFVQEAYFKENFRFEDGYFGDTAVFSILTPFKEKVFENEMTEKSALLTE